MKDPCGMPPYSGDPWSYNIVIELEIPPNYKLWFRWTPHPIIVTISDKRDYIRVLLYSYYTTITGVLLSYGSHDNTYPH